MHSSQLAIPIRDNSRFEQSYRRKIRALLSTDPVNRGPAHAMKDDTTAWVHELLYLREVFKVDVYKSAWQEVIKPNLPWAEDHFQERISGEPLNPAPSEAWWPFARQGNAEHKKEQKFSHTYPERFWPKFTRGTLRYIPPLGDLEMTEMKDYAKKHGTPVPLEGVRFEYGDFNDLVAILKQNHRSRQAYLPIWFPEDLTAGRLGERVPCSMGYHFLFDEMEGMLDCVYTLRSCDVVRFYRDDMYMAGRLLQTVAQQINQPVGRLIVNIDNLHCFPDDRPMLELMLKQHGPESDDIRNTYRFEALS